ncbi:MAG: DMT family transporter [Verrucomicrobiota bacterium]
MTLPSTLASSTRGREQDLSRGYLAVFATVIIWSLPSLFQYYLLRYYDVWAQNFYRYSVACVAIAPLVYLRLRRGGARYDWRAFRLCLLPTIPNVVHQITQTIALYYIGPGVYAVFARSTVIVTALLALALFPEERRVIRQWQFQLGTLLGLGGAVGVFWFEPGFHTAHLPFRGIAIAFAATFCWALYGVFVKRASAELGAIRSFGMVSFLTSLFLLPLTLAFGKIGTPLHVGWHVNVILIVSAVTCITMAHVLYYVAIHQIGVALAQTLQLLCPLGAVALSAFVFGERLTTAQFVCGGVLLIGAFLAMKVKPPASAAAENL